MSDRFQKAGKEKIIEKMTFDKKTSKGQLAVGIDLIEIGYLAVAYLAAATDFSAL